MTVTAAPAISDLSLIIPGLKARRRDPALTEMSEHAHRAGAARAAGPLAELLHTRERIGSTGLGKGVALPHVRSLLVTRPVLLLARSTRGIEWSGEDDEPVQLVALVLAPAELGDDAWHTLLARASTLGRLQKHRQRLLAAGDADALLAAMRDALAATR